MRDVAALVNLGAYRVTADVVATLERALGDGHVYATRSIEEAGAAIQAIGAAGSEVVCVVGGDGTFIQAASDVLALGAERRPILFALPYGLGNAIADVSGARSPSRRGLLHDLARARGAEPGVPLHLLRANGRVACYAGLGMDAIFVEDLYAVAKGRWKRIAATLGGATGLVATVLGRTLPRLLAYRPPHVRVVARAPAAPLDARGRRGAEVPAGTLLHDGPALMIAGGTIASYGKQFQAFPLVEHATPDGFQLRAWTCSASAVVRHLPAIWRGAYFPADGVRDWAARAISITWSSPHIIHIGGDLCPPTTSLELELMNDSIKILVHKSG